MKLPCQVPGTKTCSFVADKIGYVKFVIFIVLSRSNWWWWWWYCLQTTKQNCLHVRPCRGCSGGWTGGGRARSPVELQCLAGEQRGFGYQWALCVVCLKDTVQQFLDSWGWLCELLVAEICNILSILCGSVGSEYKLVRVQSGMGVVFDVCETYCDSSKWEWVMVVEDFIAARNLCVSPIRGFKVKSGLEWYHQF